MKIGEALRFERKKLCLSQQQMCEGIISRPHYAKVENGEYIISSDNLFKILLKNEVDIVEFYNLIQDTSDSKENKINKFLQQEMDNAVNTKKIKQLEILRKKILFLSNNEILKLRAIVTVAYFKGEVNELDDALKVKIKNNFDESNHWTERPELLRLFTNKLPLWSQEELEFFISRLLIKANENNLSELMLERYLRTFLNYLAVSYDRHVYGNNEISYNNHIDEVIDYIFNNTTSFHMMIYRIVAIYMNALFKNNGTQSKEIREDMKKYGYEKFIANWPE